MIIIDRDALAAGFMANMLTHGARSNADTIANVAYAHADALIRESEAPVPGDVAAILAKRAKVKVG